MKHLLPHGWQRPKGYSNGISVSAGKTIYVAGLVGWNKEEKFESDNLTDQFRTTLENIIAVLANDGAGPENVVRMTWYITDKKEYLSNLKEMGTIYREIMGKNYPVMACVEVSALMEDQAKIEIETTAVIEE
ncbi:RidA family protein [Emcibacteraceae bacterium]|uniref:RidA family protein n=1 Tax=Pseudemcibacter sp. TaxID=2943293 RepID=UPI00231A03D7|nr:RidA family protein [Emcibacteraceae bacterium]MDA9553377.1 RidA family protein [Emcibacteraceae bacterium]MDA9770188.1 RidA family protein [Emcibacteraceae bacterium]